MIGLEEREFTRVDREGSRPDLSPVAIEEPLQIFVDGRPVAVLMRTPGNEKELAVGFCISEGLIGGFDQVALVQHCGRLGTEGAHSADGLDISRNLVSITTIAQGSEQSDPRMDVLRLVRSGCGRTSPDELAETLQPVLGRIEVTPAVLASLSAEVIRSQQAYRQSGGIHAVAIFDVEGRLIVLGEDIGRHNAIDKAVGYCLLRGIRLDDKILYSTGRASYEMVMKSVRVGIPITASRSSPTTLAIDLAHRLGCTLVGYARGERLNIYSHTHRIAG